MGRRRGLHLERHGQEIAAWAFDYDADGRIAAVTDPTGGRTLLACDGTGNLVGLTHPNGVTSSFTHDPAGQLVELVHSGPIGERFGDLSCSYDQGGNRIVAGPARYRYDALDRLIGVVVPSEDEQTFTYDQVGNRTAAGNQTFTYDDVDQVVSDGTYAYQHDAAGNLVARRPLADGPGELTCTWDALGRLLSLTTDGQTVTFSYDAFGRRVLRRDAAGETTRVFDGANVIEQRLDDGSPTFETTAGLLVLNRIHLDGDVDYFHADANANAALITDRDGSATPAPGSGPWGEPLGPPPTAGSLGFAGAVGVRAETGGLYDMRARFYDPHLGRFISRDPWPATLPGPATLNRYAYALNDPVSLVDPSGLFCWTGKNAEGKCRGVKDVAHRVAKPLEMVSTVATAVAVTAVGLTVVCPPCALVTLPVIGLTQVAASASYVALAAGAASTLIHCSEKIVSFDCAKGVAAATVGFGLGGQIEGAVGRLAGSRVMAAMPEDVGVFAARIFDLGAEGVSGVADRIRK
jgi:RHS repeat-associated protein